MRLLAIIPTLALIGCGNIDAEEVGTALTQEQTQTQTQKDERAAQPEKPAPAMCSQEETDDGIEVWCDGHEKPIVLKHGKNGRDGQDGRDGVDGVDGLAGRDGIDGQAGRDGVDGIDGSDGADGRDGVDGIDGAQGIQGERGEKGDRGDQGIAGADGADGIDGQDGQDALRLTVKLSSGETLGQLTQQDTTFNQYIIMADGTYAVFSETAGTLQTARILYAGANCTGEARLTYMSSIGRHSQLHHDGVTGQFLKANPVPETFAYASIQTRDGSSACANTAGSSTYARSFVVYSNASLMSAYPWTGTYLQYE